MAFKLRFVQKFQQANAKAFMALEAEFARLEREIPEFPKGKRWVPYLGRDPVNTLVWEAEFPTLQKAIEAKLFFEGDDRHEDLFAKQVVYFIESYVEIYSSVCDG
jgi:hypothetical protein